MDDESVWKLIDTYFRDNPQILVRHHIESYNDFFKTGIFQIFKEKNPIKLQSGFDETLNDYKHKCVMYFGGKDGTKIYFGKPVIYEGRDTTEQYNDNDTDTRTNTARYLFPNEARLRNLTYGMSVHYDIDIEFIDILQNGEEPTIIGGEFLKELNGGTIEELYCDSDDDNDANSEKLPKTGGAPKKAKVNPAEKYKITPKVSEMLKELAEKSVLESSAEDGRENRVIQKRLHSLEKIYLGKFPIMVQSDFCILSGMNKELRFNMGECKSDIGGYFIIDGKEKTVVPQEKFADNMLYIKHVDKDDYLYSAEIRSISENISKPNRTLSVKIVTPTSKYTNKNIVVNIPNVRKPIPLFIVFRALGVISDKDIITTCLLDTEKYSNMLDAFIPSIHDSGIILTQQSAIKYIATFTKGKTESYVMEILSDFFLPHIGEINFKQKAYYLGYIVFRLLSVYMGLDAPTNRDNFKYKRIELIGSLLSDLFREYYTIQSKEIYLAFEKTLYFNESLYGSNLFGLIENNYKDVFKQRSLDDGFKRAFKGNWGAYSHTKRIGIIQDLNRLSFNSSITHLRKINLQMDTSNKLVEPHELNASQWGFIDPMDTPDGGNIGLHKSLSIMTHITLGIPRDEVIRWLRKNILIKLIEECSPGELFNMTKIFINGLWLGILDMEPTETPIDIVAKIKKYRRNALIPIYISVSFSPMQNTIFIYSDAGRLSRPVLYKDEETGCIGDKNRYLHDQLNKNYTWCDIISGFNPKKIDCFDPTKPNFYELYELYEDVDKENNPNKIERFVTKKAIVDYIDSSETENILIAFNAEDYANNKQMKYTHCEIHSSLILGVMCNQIPFPENNQLPRNVFSCSQSKQACSLYHSNYNVRMDKTSYVLNYGEVPLIKTRYMKYLNNEEIPYGENVTVAIMSYTGYNMEDSILFNEGALNRGLFRTSYFTCYEVHEETSKTSDITVEKRIGNIESIGNVVGVKPSFEYGKLNKHGIINEGEHVNDKTILIGMTESSSENKNVFTDNSKVPKKGQVGIVDKSIMIEGEEGQRIAKVRLLEQRIPNLGDKFACSLPTQQVLTNKGWVSMIDIDINIHKVATTDKNGYMMYEYPTNKFEYKFGDCLKDNDDGGDSEHNLFLTHLYSIKTETTEMVCTLNHNMCVSIIQENQEYDKINPEFTLIPAYKIVGKPVLFKNTLDNNYAELKTVETGTDSYDIYGWLLFIGTLITTAWISEKNVIFPDTGFGYVLNNLNIGYNYSDNNSVLIVDTSMYPDIFNDLIDYNTNTIKQTLPDNVWNFSKYQCRSLLNTMIYNISVSDKNSFNIYTTTNYDITQIKYMTDSIDNANDVCRLAIHCGYSSNIQKTRKEENDDSLCGDSYKSITVIINNGVLYPTNIKTTDTDTDTGLPDETLNTNNSIHNDNNTAETIIPYNGIVYCIEMPTSNTYFFRETTYSQPMMSGNSRIGQKGVCGLLIPETDMPFTKDGMRPDIIINPHALPSRMTIGQLLESIIGKACAGYGAFGECTAFINKGSKHGSFGELLVETGFHSSGNEILYNGMDGNQIEMEIFVGPTYYMRLKHMVKDKINYRPQGPRSAITRQPVGGRANDGGLRIGEMERDSLLSHGITEFLKESMLDRGDKFRLAICNNTGVAAIYNSAKNLFMSPMSDGPINFTVSTDTSTMNLQHITKYGRDFSIICIPYAFKLLMHELQAMNIQLRIITEDNINQFSNMNYSTNIDELINNPNTSPSEIINSLKKKLSSNNYVISETDRETENIKNSGNVQRKAKKLRILDDNLADTGIDDIIELDDTDPLFEMNEDEIEGIAGMGVDVDVDENGIPDFSSNKPLAIRSGNPEHSGLWRITHAGSRFYTVSPIIEPNEQFARSVQVVDKEQLYDPTSYVTPPQSANVSGGMSNNNNLANSNNITYPVQDERAVEQKINVFIGAGAGAGAGAGIADEPATISSGLNSYGFAQTNDMISSSFVPTNHLVQEEPQNVNNIFGKTDNDKILIKKMP
jgi:DNA-directed RNA polymerase beta subunit